MWRFEKERGFFLLTNKLTGEIKVIEVPFDWDRADALLKKGERIYAALADPTGQAIPDACDDHSVCQDCQLQHLCTAPCASGEMEIDTGELEELILRKEELAPMCREYNDVRDQIKHYMSGREKVLAGDYIVTAKTVEKRDILSGTSIISRRISIKRI